jgi:hypothetical protein
MMEVAKGQKKRRGGLQHRFRHGKPEPVHPVDWALLKWEVAMAGLLAAQVVLQQLLIECRMLAQAVKLEFSRILQHCRAWRSQFVCHVKVQWPAVPKCVEAAAPAENVLSSDDEAGAELHAILEVIVTLPGSLMLMLLHRQAQQLLSNVLCDDVESRSDGASACDSTATRFVWRTEGGACISDLVALTCGKTRLFPSDFYVASEGRRLLPSSSVVQSGQLTGSTLCCFQIRCGGAKRNPSIHSMQSPGHKGQQVSLILHADPLLPCMYYRSILNIGNECFINSAIQLLLRAVTPTILASVEAQRVLQSLLQNRDPLTNLLASSFLDLSERALAPSMCLSSETAMRMVKMKGILEGRMHGHRRGQQNDPNEIISIILETLPCLGRLFRYSVITNTECSVCHTVYCPGAAVVETCLSISVVFQQDLSSAVCEAFRATHNVDVDCEVCRRKASVTKIE